MENYPNLSSPTVSFRQADKYATHKTALVRSWLAKRPRYHLHFTPTHSSWINQVERWFAQLSQKQIKRGNHHSVKQLQEAIETFVKDHNASPKPFRWVKSADQILASITRFARSAVLKEINDSGHWRLPADQFLAALARATPSESQPFPDVSLANVHVLVVDDEVDARELVKRLLEMAGATVSMAGSASEAIERILAARPDVLVCDIGMPAEDGFSLIRQLRVLEESRESALPAVALTAYARSEDRTKAIRSGFQNHVAKPVEPAEPLAIVSSLAGRSQSPNSIRCRIAKSGTPDVSNIYFAAGSSLKIIGVLTPVVRDFNHIGGIQVAEDILAAGYERLESGAAGTSVGTVLRC